MDFNKSLLTTDLHLNQQNAFASAGFASVGFAAGPVGSSSASLDSSCSGGPPEKCPEEHTNTCEKGIQFTITKQKQKDYRSNKILFKSQLQDRIFLYDDLPKTVS